MRRALRLTWRTAKWWAVAWAVLLVVQGLLPAGVVYITKWLVDSVAAAVGQGASWDVVNTVALPAVVMGGLLILQRSLGAVNEWVNTAQSELVQDRVKSLIHRKAASVDYAFYESSAYYDRLEQANSRAASQTLSLLKNIGGLFQSSITIVSIAVILLQYSLWLPLILLVSTAPAFAIVLHYNRKYHEWWKSRTPDQRWASYYDAALTRPIPAAELRILQLGPLFQSRYKAIRERLRTEKLAIIKQRSFATVGAGLIAIAVTGGTMAWIAWRALKGAATLGDLALFYQAFSQAQNLVRSLFNSAGQIYGNTLFLEHLFRLLDQTPDINDPDRPRSISAPLRQGIDFEDITFYYPSSDTPALEDFSLHIPAGRITAIVGENGAGKSTLTKLLARFYDPRQGRVTWDGVDIREFAVDDLRRHISLMFQDPVRYQAPAAENIAVGDIERLEDRQAIIRAAQGAGADSFIERMPNGYDSMLGKLFESGTELSGGEWQRIALARAFLRKAPVVVLDEPTSFMDSWAESKWLRRFKRLVEGQTAVIITHRFTTAMQADIIHVMMEGRIRESGSHQQLLDKGGLYASSWAAQIDAADQKVYDFH